MEATKMAHGVESAGSKMETVLRSEDLEKNGNKTEPRDIDDLITILGLGKWTLLMISPYLCWGFVLPYFSIGSAFLNPSVDHWCEETYTNISGHNVSSVLWIETDGERKRSSCERYDLETWRSTAEDFAQPTLAAANISDRLEYPPEYGDVPEYGDGPQYGDSHLWNMTGVPVKQCDSWVYDTSTFKSTITTEWDLVCAAAGLSPFFQSFYYFGTTIGEPLLGYLSDKLGRRWVLRRIWILFAVASITSATATSYPLLLAMRFLLGVVHTAGSVAYVMVVETCPSHLRSRIGLCLTTTYSLTGAVFAGLAYFVREWRTLQGICIAAGILHLFYMPFLLESPRWLLQHGKFDEAKKTLQKAAHWHRAELPKDERLQQVLVEQHSQTPASSQQATTNNGWYNNFRESFKRWLKDFLTLVKTPVMRSIFLSMSGCWFVVGLSFWGMSLAGGSFSSDPFLYLALSSFTEIIGYTWILPLLSFMGRRSVLVINFGACAAAMLTILAIPKENTWVIFALAMAGKQFIAGAYNLLYLYAVELFPTCVRNRGLNISSMMSRIASISAPFVVKLFADSYSWAPSVVFGSAAAAGTLLALLLPETKGRPLLDSVEQVEEAYTKKKEDTRSKARTSS